MAPNDIRDEACASKFSAASGSSWWGITARGEGRCAPVCAPSGRCAASAARKPWARTAPAALAACIALLAPAADAANYPCSKGKGGVSHCMGTFYVCHNGTTSQSKTACSARDITPPEPGGFSGGNGGSDKPKRRASRRRH